MEGVNMVEMLVSDFSEKTKLLQQAAERNGFKRGAPTIIEPENYTDEEVAVRRDMIDNYYFFLIRDRSKIKARMNDTVVFNTIGTMAFSTKLPQDIRMRALAIYLWHFRLMCLGVDENDEFIENINTLNKLFDINKNPYIKKLKDKAGKNADIWTYHEIRDFF